MQPRIVFVIMSAVHSADAVQELACTLAPHRVLIHHDFAQTPDFAIPAPNASFVPDPRRTGWACWGFSEGIFHSLRHALEHFDFDYLQLLSPTCLPIKPLRAFESHVADPDVDAHFDCIDVAEDLDALMSVGYRAYAPEDTLRHRILRRLCWHYFYRRGLWAEDRPEAGVRVFAHRGNAGGALPPVARIALWTMKAIRNPTIGRHVFDSDFHPQFGSVWFGARRVIVARMVDRFGDHAIQEYFRRLRIADEFLIPTLLRYSGARRGPGHHLVNTFVDANPKWFEAEDFDRLCDSGAYFARKFRDDLSDPIRRRVLDELVATTTRQAAAVTGA